VAEKKTPKRQQPRVAETRPLLSMASGGKKENVRKKVGKERVQLKAVRVARFGETCHAKTIRKKK